jgi:hypothetical protein
LEPNANHIRQLLLGHAHQTATTAQPAAYM